MIEADLVGGQPQPHIGGLPVGWVSRTELTGALRSAIPPTTCPCRRPRSADDRYTHHITARRS